MGFLSDLADCACEIFSSVIETFSNGVSLVLDSFSGVVKTIGEGIKDICDKLGGDGIMLIGCIALSLIIPGFGLPEILTLIQIVGKVAQMLNVGGKDTPEETGMKTEIADKKPDDFQSTEEYLRYLTEEVKLEPGATEKLSPEEKAKYGLIGSALDIKVIQEKYHIELSPDFLRDVTIMKMSGEEVGTYVKDLASNGITRVQDMTDYIRQDKPIESDKTVVSNSIKDTMKTLYPELSEDQIQFKIDEMGQELEKYKPEV